MSDKLKTANTLMQALPHAVALGMELQELADGTAVIRMPYADKLVGDPKSGVVHGGAVSALMDTSCGAAVMSHPSNIAGTATIGLRIEYLRAATPGQTITARATCYHVTRSVAFVRATASDEDSTTPVATATGSFAVEQRK
tara:strand:+ start:2623 stop:3045 length:423 start_codon:yes stop_codon:yes gene_type:complete